MQRLKSFFSISLSLMFLTCADAERVLQDMNGHEISLSDLRGKWVFINYWASWCQSCLEEIPALNRFYDENKNNNIALFAVNYDALPLEMQQKLIKKFDIHYPSLKQDPAKELQLGDIRGVPVTFVINPQGRISEALYGGQSVSSLQEVIAAN
jgi:thiol-disulfide isomerase/thioredoxin